MRPDQPKKGLEQANKQIRESTFAEPTRNAGHLGDLAKSTYNHLVTFDFRGT